MEDIETLGSPTFVETAPAVRFDETCIAYGGQQVSWSALLAVFIETTDRGPSEDDLFWVLVGSDDCCVVPDGAAGIGELVERLQELPGFDNRKMIEAMACAARATFPIWRRR